LGSGELVVNPTLKRSGFCFLKGLEGVMNWALFGAIWSFEMVVVFGYLAASGKLFVSNPRAEDKSCSSHQIRAQRVPAP
jgi:hypothetical protein